MNIRDRGRVYRNGVERNFAEWARAQGWKVTKRGWPDFFCETPDGLSAVVECKKRGKDGEPHLLRKDQARVLKLFKALGVPAYVYVEDTLEAFDNVRHNNNPVRSKRAAKFRPRQSVQTHG